MLPDPRSRTCASAQVHTVTPGRRHLTGWVAVRVLAILVVLGGALSAGVSSAAAATASTPYNLTRVDSQDPQASGRWSERLATVPDFDHDGVNEILIADLNESYGGFTQAGRVYMQDGDTRRIMYAVDSPEIQANAHFGFFISVIGDVNRDGVADFAAGTDAQNVDATTGASCTTGAPNCNTRQGKAWVFSGANGRALYALNDPNPQAAARFGSRIGRAGDINGDGIPDIIVGASGSDMPAGCGHNPDGTPVASLPADCRTGEGAAYIFSGANGSLLRSLHLPASDQAPAPCASSCGSFGLAVQSPGDINRDGVGDHLVDAGSFNYDTATGQACKDPLGPTCMAGQGAEYLFSGKDGSLIRRTDDPVPQAGAVFGFQDVEPLAPGDVNGDGVPDYYANGFGQDGPPASGSLNSAGRAWVFSGKTGALLYEVKSPNPTAGGQFGWSMARTDFDRDGDPDLYVGSSPHHVAGSGVNQSGGTFVFDGKDGSLLRSFVLPANYAEPGGTNNNGSNLGWSIAAPGDLNGDGEPDYVAGSPFEDVSFGAPTYNCQIPTPGCVQDVGTQFLFLSNNQVNPVTTNRASGISGTSAVLHGAIDTRGNATRWQFQYGRTRGYGRSTSVRQIAAGLGAVAVSQKIGHLRPFTTYHFRLVATTASTNKVSYGRDLSFRTKGTGRLLLDRSHLNVSNSHVLIPFTCASSLACQGRVTVNTRTKIANNPHTGLVLCATNSYHIGAHRRHTVSIRVRGACLSLLRKASHQTINGRLTSDPRTSQAGVIRTVRLVLR